ncbi:hypothetical protein [Planotetraspora kaengkrachanensis]|uniref:VOC family protein n=1 Tax=Planotetraspora kaengkrachanensis TaxID=575193 RepID=A0A8J3PS74_9ACTN|nr:hypothetical protein [Planotetraspora kaengkrachanensis]GIG80596.1 hypothetical protein Pka01_37230 [Planotetraspora kaengkrachanensis]
MSDQAAGTVPWFEIASDDPDGVERFYGDLFRPAVPDRRGPLPDLRRGGFLTR